MKGDSRRYTGGRGWTRKGLGNINEGTGKSYEHKTWKGEEGELYERGFEDFLGGWYTRSRFVEIQSG
jgi:hypothetical protein